MPNITEVELTSDGSSKVIPLDYRAEDFGVGIICDVLSGTPDYTVQLTSDDVQDSAFNPATAAWQAHSTLAALTVSAKGNLAFPCTGMRLTKNSGIGTVRMRVIHMGRR